ncbi:MAG: glycosyltransferase family 4 protein [Chitinophagales bacterium]|nr:glycosyltransferase family 4 protein [Chitinophagales bacterium]MCZ2394144.1 glycosyltransferase family 4 protein [Chitinophagales bacterium]
MSKIQKILLISTQLPYPPISGGVIKSWRLVDFLSQKYQLSLATFLKNDEEKDVQTFLPLVQLHDYYFEPIDIPRTGMNLIKSNLLFQPLNLYRNRSKKFAQKISNWAENVDAIFVDHYEMFQYVPKKFKGKVILHQHNCEYLIWDRYAQLEKNWIKKLVLKNQSFWIKNYEHKICQRANTILAAPNDKEELVKIGAEPSKFYETYHLGDEEMLNLPALKWENSESAILFVGTLTWEANIDAVLYFIRDIWPKVLMQKPDTQFFIVGKNPDIRIIQAANTSKNIILTGFVQNLDDYYTKCKIFISPLRFGSGIKVKVMNALYRGIPTVSTTIGAEGLRVINANTMMVTDDNQKFADDIVLLMDNDELWNTISVNSRKLAEELYTWKSVFDKVVQAIES